MFPYSQHLQAQEPLETDSGNQIVTEVYKKYQIKLLSPWVKIFNSSIFPRRLRIFCCKNWRPRWFTASENSAKPCIAVSIRSSCAIGSLALLSCYLSIHLWYFSDPFVFGLIFVIKDVSGRVRPVTGSSWFYRQPIILWPTRITQEVFTWKKFVMFQFYSNIICTVEFIQPIIYAEAAEGNHARTNVKSCLRISAFSACKVYISVLHHLQSLG